MHGSFCSRPSIPACPSWWPALQVLDLPQLPKPFPFYLCLLLVLLLWLICLKDTPKLREVTDRYQLTQLVSSSVGPVLSHCVTRLRGETLRDRRKKHFDLPLSLKRKEWHPDLSLPPSLFPYFFCKIPVSEFSLWGPFFILSFSLPLPFLPTQFPASPALGWQEPLPWWKSHRLSCSRAFQRGAGVLPASIHSPLPASGRRQWLWKRLLLLARLFGREQSGCASSGRAESSSICREGCELAQALSGLGVWGVWGALSLGLQSLRKGGRGGWRGLIYFMAVSKPVLGSEVTIARAELWWPQLFSNLKVLDCGALGLAI